MYVIKFMNDGCSLEVNKVEESNELYFEVFFDNDDSFEKEVLFFLKKILINLLKELKR